MTRLHWILTMLKGYILHFIFMTALLSVLSKTYAKELTLYSSDGPPHMIASNKSGIDIDIVSTVLSDLGYQINTVFSPLKRGMEQVRNKEADLFLPTFIQSDNNGIYISDAFIQYRPMIFSLKSQQLTINNLADLAGKRVVSFQGATGYFGQAYIQAIKSATYRELHDMSKLPELLLMNRYDIVVLDYYIFYYFLKMYQEQSEDRHQQGDSPLIDSYASLIQRHDLIPKVNAYVGFNDPNLRDKFNQQLRQFILDNRQEKIVEKYIGTITSRIFVFNVENNKTG